MTGEVTKRVGSGREYTVKWSDQCETTVASNSMFSAFTPPHRLDPGDHALAPYDDRFSLATVVGKATDKDGKLKLKFTDGSIAYVTLSCSMQAASTCVC